MNQFWKIYGSKGDCEIHSGSGRENFSFFSEQNLEESYREARLKWRNSRGTDHWAGALCEFIKNRGLCPEVDRVDLGDSNFFDSVFDQFLSSGRMIFRNQCENEMPSPEDGDRFFKKCFAKVVDSIKNDPQKTHEQKLKVLARYKSREGMFYIHEKSMNALNEGENKIISSIIQPITDFANAVIACEDRLGRALEIDPIVILYKAPLEKFGIHDDPGCIQIHQYFYGPQIQFPLRVVELGFGDIMMYYNRDRIHSVQFGDLDLPTCWSAEPHFAPVCNEPRLSVALTLRTVDHLEVQS